jgi:plasmid stabilization system protein ParE
MKKVIEMLERAKESLDRVAPWMNVFDSICTAANLIEEALAELKTPPRETPEQYERRTVLERDMSFVRALLRLIWQSYERNGESWGRSFQCHVLELAVELLDHHFSRDPDLHERMDNNVRETIKGIEAVVNDYGWQSRMGGIV